jgi:hypothetical protein
MFIDINDVAAELAPRPELTRLARMRETWGVILQSLPYRIGLRKPRFAA